MMLTRSGTSTRFSPHSLLGQATSHVRLDGRNSPARQNKDICTAVQTAQVTSSRWYTTESSTGSWPLMPKDWESFALQMPASRKLESMPRRHRCVIPSITSTTLISQILPRSGGAVVSSPHGCWTSQPQPCSWTLFCLRSRDECRIRVKADGRSKRPSTREYRHQCSLRPYMNGSALEDMRSSPTGSSLRCAMNSADTEKSPDRLIWPAHPILQQESWRSGSKSASPSVREPTRTVPTHRNRTPHRSRRSLPQIFGQVFGVKKVTLRGFRLHSCHPNRASGLSNSAPVSGSMRRCFPGSLLL